SVHNIATPRAMGEPAARDLRPSLRVARNPPTPYDPLRTTGVLAGRRRLRSYPSNLIRLVPAQGVASRQYPSCRRSAFTRSPHRKWVPHGIRAGLAHADRAALALHARPSVPPADTRRDDPVRYVRHLVAPGLPVRRGRDPVH